MYHITMIFIYSSLYSPHVILQSLYPYYTLFLHPNNSASKFPYSNSNFNYNNTGTSKDSRNPIHDVPAQLRSHVKKIPPNDSQLSPIIYTGIRQAFPSKITPWPNFLTVVYTQATGREMMVEGGLASRRAREKNEAGGSTLWPKC